MRSWNERLHATMPHGSSTTSKAPHLLPEEPEIIVRGKGCRVWDEKGREFIDYRNGLGPVSLGYCYPAVMEAIAAQMENGIVFGHPTALECEVSEMLCDVIPCADQARFLKTGGEACSAAIRIARAYTGHDHIIQIGYNGWLNSLASGAKVGPREVVQHIPGVPAAISALYHAAGWNDQKKVADYFEEYAGNVAAVIVSADYQRFEEGRAFYPFLREITRRNNSLLIYDEIVTGFRVAPGGVQEYFGVNPDLCVFAKAIANGMPLSVYAGARDVMATCERSGFSISSTYGGETLSLAACRATIETFQKYDVVGHIKNHGDYLWGKARELFQAEHVPMTLSGISACPAFVPAANAPAVLLPAFFRAAYRHGVSLYNVSYVNFSHQYTDCDDTLARLAEAVADLRREGLI
ncbi:MAG: aminotransferase class III-fold pyridoxal phosphate-dependent enzyme [Clostridiaceae bacterium]|nr:aminotransferase class III-fold pyridoxal phosphate-dependent enzyme [Clostridiaceae bacterium]